jgi:cobalamin biosynthetic protein CobC
MAIETTDRRGDRPAGEERHPSVGPILPFGLDHGGRVDAAVARWGGRPEHWLDLSTGVNPVPYPLPDLSTRDWAALPDLSATRALERAARAYWSVPEGAEVLSAPGASALIANLPVCAGIAPGRVAIPSPTYSEHAAAFAAHCWTEAAGGDADALVLVHPNNPDGRWRTAAEAQDGLALTVIDESFCDVAPERSLVRLAARRGTVVVKSFGKFWGLAGLRLGFAIARPDTLAPLAKRMGPWAVSGPALQVGTAALRDRAWAEAARERLARDAERLDETMEPHGRLLGGTILYRLFDVGDAEAFQERLARQHVLVRVFDYAPGWVRLGLPGGREAWERLSLALAG